MRASRRVRRRLIWLVRFLEAWFEREEIVEAEQTYRRGIEIDPKHPYFWGSLARLLETDSKRQEEAFAAYVKATELDFDNTWRRRQTLRMARILSSGSNKNLAAVREAVAHLHDIDPRDDKVVFVLVGLLALSGEWPRAKELLFELASREIGEPDFWTFEVILKSAPLDEVIELLGQTEACERWRPLYVALRAIRAGSRQYLRRVAPEVRATAESIVTRLAPELPERTASHKRSKRQR